MATRTLPMSAFSIQSARPNYAYGQPAGLPLRYNAAIGLIRAALPVDIPKTAVVSSAVIRVRSTTDLSSAGAVELSLRRNTQPLRATATWNTAPTYSSSVAASQSKTNPPAGVWYEFDITAYVQAWISGSLANYGFRLSTSRTATHYVRGATSSYTQPELVLTYATPGAPPTDLMPDGGAVATAKPTLTFTVPEETVAVQVQLNDVASATGIDFDSGEVASVSGLLNLADTAYPGLASGASTYWRARFKHTDLGWSPWSPWAEFSYVPLGTLTLDTPGATITDLTPTLSWTFSGTQTAWLARLLDSSQRVIAQSGWRSGSANAWTPAKGFSRDGQKGFAQVFVRDAVDRVAVPGYPAQAGAGREVTVDLDAGVPVMGALYAVPDEVLPKVTLTGTRSEIPDEVIIFRDGTRVARLPGVDVFAGTAFSWVDWTAPMHTPVVYRVAPVTAGRAAKGGPEVTVTPRARTICLLDPETGDLVEFFDPELTWEKPDVVAIHQTISGKTVRRRLGRSQPAGTLTARLVDPAGSEGVSAAAAALLEEWAADDAGRVFRLVAGDRNLPVTIGDVTDMPSGRTGAANGRVSGVSLAFWVVED